MLSLREVFQLRQKQRHRQGMGGRAALNYGGARMNKYAEASQGNIPYASGPVDPAAYLAQKSEMPVAPTAGGLVAISDQLEAAVNDVRAAWALFRLWPQPDPGAERV